MKMVNIKELIKHNSLTFHPGERRLMEDEEAAYFCQHGWATAEGLPEVESVASDVALKVKSGTHSSNSKVI